MIKVVKPDYHNSILNVSASIILHYGASSIYDAIPELKQVLSKKHQHVFLLLLDGMGMNIINRYIKKEDFLRKHLVKPITSVFPSTTVAATNAVITGKPPLVSGFLGWVQYLNEEDVYDTVFLNKDYYDEEKEITENFLDKYFKQPLIYDVIKKASPEVVTYELFPNFRPNGFDSLQDELKEMVNISKQDGQTFTYIYWGEPDLTEHDEGPNSKVVKKLLKNLNQTVSTYASQLNENSLLIVIADHGHQKVKPINLYEDDKLMSMLDKLPSIEARATSFFIKPDEKENFKTHFEKTYGKWYQLYTKEAIYKAGLFGFGKQHQLVEQCVGDYMAIAISNRYFQFKDKPAFKGHHAGLTTNEMMVPLIIYEKKAVS